MATRLGDGREELAFDEVLYFEPPHGFLMAQEKQTAIARIEPLDVKKSYLIVSNGEAFGVAELNQPAQIKAKEFDSEGWFNQHRIMPRERRQWWSDTDNFYIYRLKSWQPFEGVKFYENEQVIDEPKLTTDQRQIIGKAKGLPKQIQIIPDAVSITDKQEFLIYPGAKINQLNDILSATFEEEIKESNENWNEFIPLYSLALVRNPRMRVSKKNTSPAKGGTIKTEDELMVIRSSGETEIKQEDETMPFRIRKRDDEYCVVKVETDDSDGDTMGCHDTEDEAETQLAALNINVAAEGKDFFGTEQSEEQRLNFIRRQFEDQFNPKDDDEIAGGANYIWVNDIFESFIIIDEVGQLFRVDYMMLENGIIFADKERWVEVERGYRPKGFKHLTSFGPPKPEVVIKSVRKVGFMSKLKLAAKGLLDLITLAESEEKEIELDIFTNNYGVAQKEVNGNLWHFTWSTNAFEDREGEIFSTKSLENYVLQAEKKQEKGYFNLWHINAENGNFNTDFAKKEWQGVVGRFLVEAGPYFGGKKGQAAKQFFSEFGSGHPKIAPEGWGCSPEYRYLPEERATGIYENIWITRTSTLPKLAAANVWTETRQLARSKNMALSEDQIKAAIEVFQDEDFVKGLIAEGEDKTAKLEAAGVAHKGEAEKSDPKEIELDMDSLASEVGKQFTANLQPIAEAIEAMEAGLKEIGERLEKVELGKAVEDKVEKPRFTFNMQRASEDEGTIVTEGDGLKNQKPVEAAAGKGDAWSRTFNK